MSTYIDGIEAFGLNEVGCLYDGVEKTTVAHNTALKTFFTRCPYCSGHALPVYTDEDGVEHIDSYSEWAGKSVYSYTGGI